MFNLVVTWICFDLRHQRTGLLVVSAVVIQRMPSSHWSLRDL
jgi:hypothetical protein